MLLLEQSPPRPPHPLDLLAVHSASTVTNAHPGAVYAHPPALPPSLSLPPSVCGHRLRECCTT